ncbi:MAG: hypothetical protein WC876_03460 [Candidatus Thermoplasmatota archaeon]|jgi:hypothetical protein
MPSLEFQDVFRLLVPLLAAGMLFFAAQAYKRARTTRLLLFAAAFAIFFVKSLFIGTELLFPEQGDFLEAMSVVADCIILLLFFLSMTRD